MSRQCGWCTSPNRLALEARVLSGESIQSVSLGSGFHATAGHRHFRAHVVGQAGAAIRRAETSQLQLADFADRMLSLADEAATTRERATRKGDHRTAIASLREERESLGVLMNRLGIDSNEVVEALDEARALAQALSHVLRSEPAVARALASHLSDRGEGELASAFWRMADKATADKATVSQLADHASAPREIA